MGPDNITNQEILNELKKMNKLLSLLATSGRNQVERITLLNRLGFGPKEISELLGISPNQVSVTLHNEKKKSKK